MGMATIDQEHAKQWKDSLMNKKRRDYDRLKKILDQMKKEDFNGDKFEKLCKEGAEIWNGYLTSISIYNNPGTT